MRFCRAVSLFCMLTFALLASGQDAAPNTASQQALDQLRQQLRETQQKLAQSEAELRDLRDAVSRMQVQLAAIGPGKEVNSSVSDDMQLLNAKVNEQEQTKVESASKFHLKLSGMFLFTAFSNAGTVDNIDLPTFAVPASEDGYHGSSGASLRQSIIGLTGTGPLLAGARTSADLQLDFFGGMPSGYARYSSGLARLRIARMRLDWANTSVVAGLDTPFFSPNSPTSYMTVAEPALSNSGNLWAWMPMIRVEHRHPIGSNQLKLEAGLIDYASYNGHAYSLGRVATPAESSRQPAYSLRVSLNRPEEETKFVVGVGGILIPQRYSYGRKTTGWSGTSDFSFAVSTHFELQGEFFAGRGIDGFGGVTTGLPTDPYYTPAELAAPALSEVLQVGGWSQLKYKLNSRSEFNAAGGYGGFSASQLEIAGVLPAVHSVNGRLASRDIYGTYVPARNQTFFGNYIYRPRSDLIFSLEYRHFRTYGLTGPPATADQVGASAGFLF